MKAGFRPKHLSEPCPSHLPFAFCHLPSFCAAPPAQKFADDLPYLLLHFLYRAVGVHHLYSLGVTSSNREIPLPHPLLKLQPGNLKTSVPGLDPTLASIGTLECHTGSHVKKQSEVWLCHATNNPVESAHGASAQPASVTLIREARVIKAIAEDHFPS